MSQTAIRAEPALSQYDGNLLLYYPHINFLGFTFDNRMTFTKHFEGILEHCNQTFHRLRILVNKKCSSSPTTILQIYKQCVRSIFEYRNALNKRPRIVNFYHKCFGIRHQQNTKSPEHFY